MSVRYLSLCSGIEAASVAWHPLGWLPVGFSEIEAFPSAVLAHRFPDVPNLGDMTKFKDWPDATFDVLVGGTPCQSFSVAGLRKGLADPRGNLALTYLAIADRYRPEWLLWENVPGVLSSEGGRDFGAFLGGLGQLGYGFAYRVLDAQYIRVDGFGRAVPQRRRRVFVVGHSDWRRAAAVLFDAASLYGDPAPRREAGERVAGTLAAGAHPGRFNGQDAYNDKLVAYRVTGNDGAYETGDHVHALTTGTDRSASVIAFDTTQITSPLNRNSPKAGDPCHPLAAGAHPPAVAFDMRGRDGGAQLEGPHATANIRAASGGSSRSYVAHEFGAMRQSDVSDTLRAKGGDTGNGGETLVEQSWAVRRLTPMECERLQGFPDGWTDIPMRGKPAADGPRYKALGNSMAVNAMRWIGRRIEAVNALPCAKEDAA